MLDITKQDQLVLLLDTMAGYYVTGSFNTFVGSESRKRWNNICLFSSGQNNVAIGYETLKVFTTADITTPY